MVDARCAFEILLLYIDAIQFLNASMCECCGIMCGFVWMMSAYFNSLHRNRVSVGGVINLINNSLLQNLINKHEWIMRGYVCPWTEAAELVCSIVIISLINRHPLLVHMWEEEPERVNWTSGNRQYYFRFDVTFANESNIEYLLICIERKTQPNWCAHCFYCLIFISLGSQAFYTRCMCFLLLSSGAWWT